MHLCPLLLQSKQTEHLREGPETEHDPAHSSDESATLAPM